MYSFFPTVCGDTLAKVSLNISQSQKTHLAPELQGIVSLTLTAPSVPWDPLVYTRLLLSHCPEGSVHSRSFRDSCLGTLDSVVLNCVLSQPLTQAVDRASCSDALGITLFYASATRSVA